MTNRPAELKFSSPSDRHAKMMAELDRLIRLIFEDEPKQESKKEVGDNGR